MNHRKYISAVTAALIVAAAGVGLFIFKLVDRGIERPEFFFESPEYAPTISEPVTPPPSN